MSIKLKTRHLGTLGVAFCIAAVAFSLVFYHADTSGAPEPETSARFGSVSLKIEIASTTESRRVGLSGREHIADDYGMLFVFEPPAANTGIWMKDMLLPIDIFWLDDKGQVVHIEATVDPDTYPHVFYSPVPATYVLETMAGLASAGEITIGTRLELQNLPIVLQ